MPCCLSLKEYIYCLCCRCQPHPRQQYSFPRLSVCSCTCSFMCLLFYWESGRFHFLHQRKNKVCHCLWWGNNPLSLELFVTQVFPSLKLSVVQAVIIITKRISRNRSPFSSLSVLNSLSSPDKRKDTSCCWDPHREYNKDITVIIILCMNRGECLSSFRSSRHVSMDWVVVDGKQSFLSLFLSLLFSVCLDCHVDLFNWVD